TTVDKVRFHLGSAYPVFDRVRDYSLVVTSNDYLILFGGAIDAATVVAKTIEVNDPTRKDITLSSGGCALDEVPIVVGSVVVASDSSLGTVFVENTDYIIDYDSATIHIKPGGGLTVSQMVSVWFLPYRVLEPGTDYQVDAEQGRFRALPAGHISVGQTVRIDFSPRFDSYNDEILNNAVAMANGMIEQQLDPERQFGADPTLESTATYRALEIICRTAAARELSRSIKGDNNARVWMDLADRYEDHSDKLVRAFGPPRTGLKPPRHT
ncbi:MAG: hypothetical protein JSU65_07480, partial [Candidatus Zixiibacteriota bacterium]